MANFSLKSCDMSQYFMLIFLAVGSQWIFLSLLCLSHATAIQVTAKTGQSSERDFQSSSSSSSSNFDSNPRLEIFYKSKSRSEKKGDFYARIEATKNKLYVHRSSSEEYLILCIAPYPIEWKMSTLMLQAFREHLVDITRSSSNESKIQKLYKDDKNKIVEETINHNAQAFKPEDFFFHLKITIQFKGTGIFGYLGTCQKVGDKGNNSTIEIQPKSPPLATRLDLFAPEEDPKPKYFIGAGRRFKIINYQMTKSPDGNASFLIPCPLFNPKMSRERQEKANIKLVKIMNQTFQTIDSLYDPESGFYVQKMDNNKLEGTFQCLAGLFQEKSDAGASSNKSKGGNGTNSWRAKENVTFEFVQNEGEYQNLEQEDWLDVSEEDKYFNGRKSTEVEYRGDIWIGVDSDVEAVGCRIINDETNEDDTSGEESDETSHEESYENGNEESEENSKKESEDEDENENEDGGADNNDSEFSFIRTRCNSQVHCDFLSGCTTEECGGITDEGTTCAEEENTCLYVDDTRVTSLLKCFYGGKEVFAYSYIGLNHKQYYTNVHDAKEPPVSALVLLEFQPPQSEMSQKTNKEGLGKPREAKLPQNSLKLYTDQAYNFKCKAARFLFAAGVILLAEYANGSKLYFPQGSVHTSPWTLFGNHKVYARVTPTLNMTRVVCLAPWIYSFEWMEESNSVTVKDTAKPRIQSEPQNQRQGKVYLNETGEQRIFYIGDKDKNLNCFASGQPPPILKWTYENGTEITTGKDLEFSISQDAEDSSILRFPTIGQHLEGTYVCVARNRLGKSTYQFHVKVQVKVNTRDLNLHVGEIIGIVFGILIFLAAFVFTLFKYWQTKKQLRNLTADEIDEFEKGNPDALKNAEVQGENAHLLPFNKEYEIPISNFSIDQGKILGSGEFGVVYSGKLHDLAVAIKTTKSNADVDFFKAFLKEIKVMTFIGKHPNVVQLLGTSTNRIQERVVYVVVELATHGSLFSFLMKNEANFVDTLCSSQLFDVSPEKIPLISTGYAGLEQTSQITMTTRDFVTWCGQIAAGMSHLASKKIIHGDLAPRNILLFDDYTAKITDFGLSRQLYTEIYTKTQRSPLPWRILAPESLKHRQFSTKSDVWAFGVLTWEIFSLAAVPFSGLNWTQDFVANLEQGLRLQKPKPASDEIYEIMSQCWNLQPEARPDFDHLGNCCNNILERFRQSEAIYLTIA